MPYYGPNEDSYTIFFERTLLAGMFIVGVDYGMQVILYIVCTRYLWRERNRRGRAMLFFLVYITLLLALSALWASAATWMAEDIYINNRNYPGGPWSYFLATQNSPEDVIFIVALFVLTFLSDLLMIWRCWVIWTSYSRPFAYVVVAFPFLTLLASFVLGTMWILQSSLPGVSPYMNIAVTILITLCLARHRRVMLESLPPEYATHYLSLAAIFVESAALYSAVVLALITSFALNNPVDQIFLTISPASQQIASYLIILRLAQGRAWSPDTLAGTTGATSQLTTIQFSAPTTNAQVDSNLRPNQQTLKPEP